MRLRMVRDDADGCDYEYTPMADEMVRGCWITLRPQAGAQGAPISVHIVPTDEGVVVDLHPQGREAEETLSSTWALFTEAGEDESEPQP